MKKQEKDNKDALIRFRIRRDDKMNFKSLATERGITLSKLILTCLDNRSVPDFKARLQLLNGVGALVKEMNAIGNNINQITVAIHLINKSKKIGDKEFKDIVETIQLYQIQEKEIKSLINRLLDEQFDV